MVADAQTDLGLAAENRLTVAESTFLVAARRNDQREVFEASLEFLTARYYVPGDHANSLAPFRRIVEILENNPPWWTDAMTRRVLWEFKAILNCLYFQPSTQLATIENLLTEMEEKFDHYGYDPRPVAGQRAKFMLFTQGASAAESLHDQWLNQDPTILCDCSACVPTVSVELSRLKGDDAASAALGLELLANHGEDQCVHEPQGRYALLVEPLLATGHDAHAAWARACSIYLDREKPLRSRMLVHAEVAARSGDLEQAALLFGEAGRLPAGDPYDEALSLGRAAGVASRLADEEARLQFGVALEGPADELSVQLADRALDLAQAFDARNGNGLVTARVEAVVDSCDLPALPHIQWTPETPPPS